MSNDSNRSRRKFIQQAGIAGAGLVLAGPLQTFAQTANETMMSNNIKSRGYAGKDVAGKMFPWDFERRAVGDNDVLIEIKYSGICHSDIHTIKGHWGEQKYPQVQGHEFTQVGQPINGELTADLYRSQHGKRNCQLAGSRDRRAIFETLKITP